MACDKQSVYHTFQTLPIEGWPQKDTLTFNVPVTDSMVLYNIFLEVRNRNNYPYQNLPLILYVDGPDASILKTDTLQLALADKNGVWQGNGWGGLYQSSVPAGNIYIKKTGQYKIRIAYSFSDKKLSGINDIGINIKKSYGLE
jgi:gliding motility-associated lipoprotein GldH